MLEKFGSAFVERPVPSGPDFPSPAELLESLVHFLRQQYRIISVAVILSLAAGGSYLAIAQPNFTAAATMLIDPNKSDFLQQQPLSTPSQVDSASVESQISVLNSDTVALSVIKKLQLSDDSEFVGSDVADASEYDRVHRALDIFRNRLSVTRDTFSYVIKVSFRSYDAAKSAEIANAVVDAYITDQLDAKYQSTLRASEWLQDRLEDLRSRTASSEQAIVDYKREHDIIDAAGKSASSQRVNELNSQLLVARAQLAEARARMDRIKTVLSADSTLDATVADSLHDDVVTRLRSQYLDLTSKETDWAARYGSNHLAVVNLRNQMADTRAAIMDELRRIAEAYKSDFAISKQKVDEAQNQYDRAIVQANKDNQAQVVLSELQSKAKTYRGLYENFLQRYMDSVQQQTFPITQARLISAAVRPLRPSSPRPFLTLAACLCFGIIGGLGIGVLRDLWDRVFRTTDQAERLLQVPCLALVPRIQAPVSSPVRTGLLPVPISVASPSLKPELEGNTGEAEFKCELEGAKDRSTDQLSDAIVPDGTTHQDLQTIVRSNDLLWTSVDLPFSAFAEALRAIKVAIDLSEGSSRAKVIGFTSALPNEGKSTVAAALGLLIARAGRRVILVDCDLRNPSLTRKLSSSAKKGIVEVIAGDASLDSVLWHWSDNKANLAFLPAVSESRLAHTNEILGSPAAKSLFDELKERYEYIIADFSPLAPIVDVRTGAQFVNAFLCVIEWGKTKIDVAKRALGDAPTVQKKLIGTVLNKADIHKLSDYEAHLGNYYSNKHYARYGYVDATRKSVFALPPLRWVTRRFVRR